MKIELAVAVWSSPCRRAEEIWRSVARERGLGLEVIDVDRPEGRALMERLRLTTVPAVLFDGRVVAVGVQSEREAHIIVDAAIGRRANNADS